jgi:CBS domain-containing protein
MKERSPVHDRESLSELQKRRESLRRVEAFPYSEDIRSSMISPVYICSPDEAIKKVVKDMSRRGISSVIVANDEREPVGILTERDILNRIVAADGIDINTVPVSRVMTPDPVTMSPEDTIYRALSVLSRYGIKHLPITEEGRVEGIVTLRQLLKLRHPEPMMLISSVQEASSVHDLREIKEKIPALVASKLSVGIDAYEIVKMLSLINQDIHRKALELSLRDVGVPPLKFCLLVTGSHGRMENLLTPDQDHAMVIEDHEEYHDHDGYFMTLTKTLSDALTEIGYAFCPGYIMSMNPTWRKSLSEWKTQIHYWFETQGSNLVRYVTLLFDAYPVYGDRELFRELSDFSFNKLRTHYEILNVLHEEERSHRVPVGFLGHFITEKEGEHRGEIEIKRSGLIFVVEGIRILSLLRSIRETSTVARIHKLVKQGNIHPDDGEYFEAAYQILLHHALETEVSKALAGEKIDTFMNPGDLSSREREMLKHAFKAVSSLRDLVATEFGEFF